MTRTASILACCYPFLVGAVLIAATSCGHAQTPPPVEWSWRSLLVWQVPMPSSNAVRVTGAAIIESAPMPYTNWQVVSGDTFQCTNDARAFRGVASYQLAWDGSPLNPENVTYTVYCNGWRTNVGTNLTAVIACQGQTNTFTVTASDPYGVESDHSNALVLPAVKPVLIITKL
jgi:hypothetical protein